MILDINSGSKNPLERDLSNLTEHAFVFEGIFCRSMEGLLQSLKFDNLAQQEKVCNLCGITAKKFGQARNPVWQQHQVLWLKGEPICRNGREYHNLLTRAFNALFENKTFEHSLSLTGNQNLIHSIGETDPRKTVLTEVEFIYHLLRLRSKTQKPA
jgi:hypothetical protein